MVSVATAPGAHYEISREMVMKMKATNINEKEKQKKEKRKNKQRGNPAAAAAEINNHGTTLLERTMTIKCSPR